MKARQWFHEIAVYLAALLFLYTAASKLMDFDTFRRQISNQVFDDVYTPWLSYGIPLAELLVAALLVWPKMRMSGLVAFTAMMAVFTGYVALVTFGYYDRVPCGCSSAFENLSWSWHLAVNIFFTLLGLTGIILQQKERKTDGSELTIQEYRPRPV